MSYGYTIYKEGTIARRSGDPLDPSLNDPAEYQNQPRSRVFIRGREVGATASKATGKPTTTEAA